MVATALRRAAAFVAVGAALTGSAAAQPPPAAAAGAGEPRSIDARIQALERGLASAVSRSASAVEGQLPAGVPGLVLFAGPIEVRGFLLEDYGVFFVVEYPVLRRSIVWSMQRLDSFELSMDITLQMLRRRFPAADFPPADFPATGRDGGRTPVGFSEARSTPLERVGGRAPRPPGDPRHAPGAPPGDPRHAPGAPPGVPASGTGRVAVDPLRVYQSALQVSLTDALLLGGAALGAMLPDDAWLTVAARDVTGLGGRDGRLRVAARDLAAFGEGRITIDEVRERVEASGFQERAP